MGNNFEIGSMIFWLEMLQDSINKIDVFHGSAQHEFCVCIDRLDWLNEADRKVAEELIEEIIKEV